MKHLSRRQKWSYFSLALFLWLVFQHGLGPLLGLSGLECRISAYVFSIGLATAYLYFAIMRQRPADHETETDGVK